MAASGPWDLTSRRHLGQIGRRNRAEPGPIGRRGDGRSELMKVAREALTARDHQWREQDGPKEPEATARSAAARLGAILAPATKLFRCFSDSPGSRDGWPALHTRSRTVLEGGGQHQLAANCGAGSSKRRVWGPGARPKSAHGTSMSNQSGRSRQTGAQ